MSEETKPVETTTPPVVVPAADTTDAAPTTPPPAVPVADTTAAPVETSAINTSITSNWTATMRRHFTNSNKYVRGKWSNVATLTHNTTTAMSQWPGKAWDASASFSPLLFIALITFLALGCSAVALSTSWWSCDAWSGDHFGMWNTCWQSNDAVAPLPAGDSNTLIVKKNVHKHVLPDLTGNETTIWSWNTNGTTTTTAEPPSISSVWKCAEQTLGHVAIVPADKVRVDHVTYSQGLMVSGAALYFISWFAVIWAWWWMKSGTAAQTIGVAPVWLNSVRNILTFAVLAQVFSFLLELVGFFLYIWTGRFSTSVVLLFFYFGIAIVSTNITNFITIEYKIFKQRHAAA